MRNDLVRQMLIEMEREPRIFFLTGDLGFRALEPIQEKFPDRFFNVGVAEQNMIGVAAGLALEGNKVIAYSIASFATMRCFEQIRTDVAYHGLNVKIAAAGGGFNYGHQGVTHHTYEDLALMRSVPGMKVFAPGYSWEATEAVKAMMADTGPCYIRLGKNPVGEFKRDSFEFAVPRGFILKDGNEVVLMCTGNIPDLAMATAARIETELQKSVCVISMPTVKPIDEKLILEKAATAEAIFTMEEHGAIGGLGAAVAEVLARVPRCARFAAFALPDHFIKDVGHREHLLKAAGLDPEQITNKVKMNMSDAEQIAHF